MRKIESLISSELREVHFEHTHDETKVPVKVNGKGATMRISIELEDVTPAGWAFLNKMYQFGMRQKKQAGIKLTLIGDYRPGAGEVVLIESEMFESFTALVSTAWGCEVVLTPLIKS
jgi:hypothetical protein